jgi:methylmalonyl-CoA carboxyltransferase small subunit
LKLKLTVDGKVYEVDVEVEEPARARPSWSSTDSGATPSPAEVQVAAPSEQREPLPQENKVCRSPISGLVVRLVAQVGQAIQANDPLMVLEAMKMETEITSPIAGVISRINAVVGESVQVGQVLVEFE